MTRHVSYLDKPYKKRVFCRVQEHCRNKKCPYKFKPADIRKLNERLGKQRVDWKDYVDCDEWQPTLDYMVSQKRRESIAQWRIESGKN